MGLGRDPAGGRQSIREGSQVLLTRCPLYRGGYRMQVCPNVQRGSGRDPWRGHGSDKGSPLFHCSCQSRIGTDRTCPKRIFVRAPPANKGGRGGIGTNSAKRRPVKSTKVLFE